jgi:hypothetical protein
MITWTQEAIAKIELGDERLYSRLLALVEAFVERPATSIPDACQTWAATHAAYLFFDNEAVKPATIIDGAAQATLSRCQGEDLILAVQDTTSLDYTSHAVAEGLGPLENPHQRGLFVHSTLAVSAAGVPLGLVTQEVWKRDPPKIGKRKNRTDLPIEAKESAKWLWALQQTEQRLQAAGGACRTRRRSGSRCVRAVRLGRATARGLADPGPSRPQAGGRGGETLGARGTRASLSVHDRRGAASR